MTERGSRHDDAPDSGPRPIITEGQAEVVADALAEMKKDGVEVTADTLTAQLYAMGVLTHEDFHGQADSYPRDRRGHNGRNERLAG